jgi:uncharacterized protein
MPNRAFIVHGYLSHPDEAWLPWLKVELEKKGLVAVLPALPHPDHPVISEWIPFIDTMVGTPDETTFLVGHSLGCQAVLRYLEILGRRGQAVARTLLVAGTFPRGMSRTKAERTAAGHPALIPWFEQGIDPLLVKPAAGRCTVILSDNDPYIDVPEAMAAFRATLAPQIVIVPGGGHFNEDDPFTELPQALDALLDPGASA